MPSESSQVKKNASALNLANNMTRQVEPQQMLGQQSAAVSSIIPETAEFRSLTEEGDEGLVARFVQDKLNLIYWVRPPEAPEMVFGCLVEAAHVPDLWKDVLERHSASSRGTLEPKPEFVLALLDDRGRPVATQPADAPARDWKRPFVASEIGEALPHWEAALYLASPTALAESARGLWRTLAFTIAGAVALIAFGGWLVVADARRQLALAQQKTDFVSNVSHELKTPLTSIRMFAELMHDRPQPAEKQNQYLRIITVEAERLTRLINNVLDFAKMGRKQKRLDLKPIDLHELAARVWESQEMHLRDAGFTTRWEAAPGPYPVLGDDDSLAQVLVNLLSNAEKYSNGNKEVELHTWLDDGWVNISVLDRGMGVPDGDEKKIFEAFYRAHDSLASGIQGSGLGLTLAQRIAREHGGEIRHEHREGGGSRFTLRIPLSKPAES
jgi:signal transduction histidine kinase